MRKIIFPLAISLFMMSCAQNDTKQKELELRERELALKEKELALKEKDSTGLKSAVKEPGKKDSGQETKKLPADIKTLNCAFQYMTCGDGCNYYFTDLLTKKEIIYNDDYDFYDKSKDKWGAAIQEIKNLCNDYPAPCSLKGHQYLITLGYRSVETPDYDANKMSKEMSWVIVALNKTGNP